MCMSFGLRYDSMLIMYIINDHKCHAQIQKIPSEGILKKNFFNHQRISQLDVQTSLEKQLDPSSFGSVPVFLKKHIAT